MQFRCVFCSLSERETQNSAAHWWQQLLHLCCALLRRVLSQHNQVFSGVNALCFNLQRWRRNVKWSTVFPARQWFRRYNSVCSAQLSWGNIESACVEFDYHLDVVLIAGLYCVHAFEVVCYVAMVLSERWADSETVSDIRLNKRVKSKYKASFITVTILA